jgi:Xaa-Pro aminopeptidase
MRKLKFFLCFLFVIWLPIEFYAQSRKTESMVDMLNVIRCEKFDFVLPQAMRENNIDMWIHVMGTKYVEEGNLDPLRLDLGGNTGYFIFTDRGHERIERAAFGSIENSIENSGAYDIVKGDISDEQLERFVAERDPKRIAVNFSDWLAVADGISYTDYRRLANAIGDKYSNRIVSAENVITDFRTRRVMSEIVFFGELCKKTVEVMEKAFDSVEPGKTTLKDLAMWLKSQNMEAGFGSLIQFGLPGVFVRDPDGHEWEADDHVVQGGDLVHLDFGLIMMNYRTDIKRLAYVLREGETTLPSEFRSAFDDSLEALKVFRKNIKVGRTAGETFEILKAKLEEAGFIYANEDEFDKNIDSRKTQVHFDFHCLGHNWGDEAVGPRISPWGQDRAHLKIPAYHLFVLEHMIHRPVPEWGKGKHIYMAIEYDAIVTDRGVEYLYPPIKEIRLIR